MEKSVKILLGVVALLLAAVAVVIVGSDACLTASSVDVVIASAPVVFFSKNITDEIIKDLRLKFGKIKVITIIAEEAELDGEGTEITPAEQYQFLVRRPDRGLIKMLLPLVQQGKLDDFADKAVKNMVVGGDMDALEDGIVFMGVVQHLKSMLAPAQSFLSNA
ncbi:MAG: hypothetical protein JW783_00325 [Bacteroidales bacterium]|nr:hypothetical protein [Bacteroidales bacterium]MBN2748466.1 hypothetical protein [Bacteroidales bacterium]